MKRPVLLLAAGLFLLSLPVAMHGQGSGGRGKAPPGAPPLAPNLPKGRPAKPFAALVVDRNTRALSALGYTRCLTYTLAAAQKGMLGKIQVNDIAVCVKEGNEWRGVFGQFADSRAGFSVHLQVVIPNGNITTASVRSHRSKSS